MCKRESIEVYEVTKETAKELQLDNKKRKKLDIEIDLEAENNYFKITSDKYVPFSNLSIEQQYLKYLIQDEVKKLCEKKEKNKILLASYQGKTPKNADIENMLLYNIGTGAFAEFFSGQETQRLAFWLESPQGNDNAYNYNNAYKYEIADPPDDNDKLPQKIESRFETNELADWTDIIIGKKLPERPDGYHFALRLNKDKINPCDSMGYEGAFGLKITLTVPKANKSSHPVSVMKHLLDGVICAFHGEAGKAKDAVEERFKNQLDKLSKELQLDKSPKELKELLEKSLKDSDKFNKLGKREYLKKNAGWNPADEADRLKFAYIIVKHTNTKKEYKMSGAIYKAIPQKQITGDGEN